jgi:hypothetical protein
MFFWSRIERSLESKLLGSTDSLQSCAREATPAKSENLLFLKQLSCLEADLVKARRTSGSEASGLIMKDTLTQKVRNPTRGSDLNQRNEISNASSSRSACL